ncbi:MAG: SIMPL domain-containing protein [Bryobacteraceae bacterium]
MHAQLDGVTTTALRTVDFAPEQATFNVAAAVPAETTLEAVLEAVGDLGLSSRNLSGIQPQQFGPQPEQSRLQYQFTITIPVDQLRAFQDRIAATRRETKRRLTGELLTEARREAEVLAQAAGKGVGEVLSVSEAPQAYAGAIIAGGFGFVPSNLQGTFSVTVRFALATSRGGATGGGVQ